jgi:hypothetical protein
MPSLKQQLRFEQLASQRHPMNAMSAKEAKVASELGDSFPTELVTFFGQCLRGMSFDPYTRDAITAMM